MGSVKVTVYGRIKPCSKNNQGQEYQIKNADIEDQITFVSNKIPTGKKTYRFKKLFAESASQEDIFETVARPVINSVLTGYNGTIFTYGQTGSGKTYTMTGDIEGWLNPGLIPRTIEEIFKEKNKNVPVTITYCEIYNEHVYDLIRVDRLDPDLPQVSLLEDSTGITHFRNLSVHLVATAYDALQLLIRGDANKMVAETTSNARSSRSHVIFSIGLELPHPTEEKLCLKPVLYLVDLAGSEKLSKCKTPMNNPLETRYINLSLHYLEQVLIALRQPGRNHIPYRNSLMTALLRNSLGGNCITAMIATFSLSLDDLEETLQTCRFAERIALIKNEVKLNELVDPQKEIFILRRENERLKTQLKIMGFTQAGEELTEKDREKCAEMVKNFIRGNDIYDLPFNDLKRIECCLHLMRDEILKKTSKEPTLKKFEKPESILDFLKKDSSNLIRNYRLETTLNDETRVKFVETNGGRKRNPIDLPKINLTYKRWKSTEEISEQETSMLKKLSSKELKIVESSLSHSSIPSSKPRVINSEYSLKNSAQPTFLKEDQKPSSYLLDGCFLKIRESGISSKHKNSKIGLKFQNDLETENHKIISATVSSIYMKSDFPGSVFHAMVPSPESSDEKFAYGELNKSISIGVQVEDAMAEVKEAVDETKSNSKAEQSSINSFDENPFSCKSLPFTGDKEIDEEILKFYKARYRSFQKK